MREFNIGTLFFNLIYIMKRFFVLAALVLGLAACQTEPEGLDVNVGGEVDTTITVSLPETTRANSALGAFENVDLNGTNGTDYTVRYIFEVYYGNTGTQKQVYYTDGRNASFPVRLVPGRHYNFVAWADIVAQPADDKMNKALPYEDTDLHYDTAELKSIKLNGEWNAMDETRDAFTGHFDTAVDGDKTPYNGSKSINIPLTRPFAKLRVITTDMVELRNLGIEPHNAVATYTTAHYSTFNACDATYSGELTNVSHEYDIASYGETGANKTIFTDYFFANNEVVNFTMEVFEENGNKIGETIIFNTPIPAQRNYLTTISGNILTDSNNVTVTVEDAFKGYINNDVDKDEISTTVNTAEDLVNALTSDDVDVIVLNGDINLNDLLTRAADPTTLTVAKTLTIDLNGKTLSATSAQTGKNYDMFFVTNSGDLTVKNGNIVYEHSGENMGWNNCTDIFRVSFNGKLTLESVTAENLGGSDMAYVVDMSNASKLSVNIDNSTLKSTYIPVRVFNNSGMHNVTIKNTTLEGKYCFWVQYWLADGRDQATLDETLNISIYHNDNTFTYAEGRSAVIYGFNETIYADEYGITKTVSEDGTEVILGSMTNDGLVRRGVAGAEENTTIKKAVVGEGITTLYDRTFRRFYALEEVVLPSTLTTIGAAGSGVFQSCTALKSIVIPESVTVLGKGSFQECSSLESINIPAGVTRIEADALRATGLVSVEFHEGVTYFGAQAFRDCKQLKEVIINAPEFTVEANAFGVTSGTLPGTTIYVANAEMKAYLESTLAYKNQFTIVAPEAVANAEQLAEALANRENVVLTQDVTAEAATTAPYGNKYAFKLDGGVIDGNGHELHMECYGDDYGIMTSGGTIKNVTIKEGCRAVMIMYPQTDVILDNVKIGGDGVLYPINTGEAGAEGVNLVVTNSVLAGWTSYGLIESATFTNVEFKQGTYYNNIYGRVLKPYVNTTLTNCSFVEHMNLDLSSLKAGHKIVMKNCKVNGQAVTASVFTIPTTDAQYDTELFTIDLPSWASSINDCVVFE